MVSNMQNKLQTIERFKFPNKIVSQIQFFADIEVIECIFSTSEESLSRIITSIQMKIAF